jgi:hypothetical protein
VRLPFVKPFSRARVDLFNFINEEGCSQNALSNMFEQWPSATDSYVCVWRGTQVKRLALVEQLKLCSRFSDSICIERARKCSEQF